MDLQLWACCYKPECYTQNPLEPIIEGYTLLTEKHEIDLLARQDQINDIICINCLSAGGKKLIKFLTPVWQKSMK